MLRAKASSPELATTELSAERRLNLMAEIANAMAVRASIDGEQKAPREALDEVLRNAVLVP